jgi:hypothetical protein
MKSVFMFIVVLALPACSTPGFGRVPLTWCSPPQDASDIAVDLPDVKFSQVRDTRVNDARELLSDRSLVPLSADQLADLAESPSISVAGSFRYLVRAGVMVPPEFDGPDVIRFAAKLDFLFSHNKDATVLNTVSLVTSETALVPANLPIVVVGPRPFHSARAVCLSGR